MENMKSEMGNVKTVQVTYAVRTTNIDGIDIEEGDIMAIGDQGILAVGKETEDTALEALKSMLDGGSELITVYYGSGVTDDEAQALASKAKQLFPDKEIELQYGGQPIYYYLISAE